MILLYAALFILFFIGAKYSGRSFNTAGYLSKDSTNAVKGVFIGMVFVSHIKGYFSSGFILDIMGVDTAKWFGQLIVTMFLFVSGYGVSESIKRKGSGYVSSFPKNRLLKTLLHFDIVVIAFLITDIILGIKYGIVNILLSFVAWESVGNSNWYIFAVIILYLMTWVGFTVFRRNNRLAAGLTTVLIVVYIFIMSYAKDGSWWYNTVLCYALGMWYSIYIDRIERVVTKNNLVWIAVLLASGAVFAAARIYQRYLPVYILEMLAFCMIIVLFTLKVTPQNRVLCWMGSHTFELFIVQRIPMLVFKRLGLVEVNIYLYIGLCLVTTVFLAIGLRKLTEVIDRVLFPKKPPAVKC